MKNYAKFAAALLAAISTAAFGAETPETINLTPADGIAMTEIYMPADSNPAGKRLLELGGAISTKGGKSFKCPSSAFDGNGLKLVWKYADNDASDKISKLLDDALKADAASIAKLIKNPKDAKKAEKFIKLSGLTSTVPEDRMGKSRLMKVGDYYALVFLPTEDSKMPLGINYMVFENIDGKFAWDPSFSDPMLGMISQSISFFWEDNSGEAEELKNQNGPKINELLENDIPFLLFKNGPLISMGPDPDVYDDDISKFYKNAQDVFYSWDLDGYGKFMTQTSAEKFNSQFSSMSEEDRKKVLTDYFSWGKKYIKVMKNNYLNIIFFERVKDGEPSKNDYAYIQATVNADSLKNGETPEFAGYKIYNFGAPKTLFDAFLGKYVLNGDYAENMKKRFKKQ